MPDFYQSRQYPKMHWGQRKLLLCEVYFLTRYIQEVNEELLVVYAGAAHGGHILHLIHLFPNFTWHLYDPAQFNRALQNYSQTKGSKVRLFQKRAGWFNEQTAAKYAPSGKYGLKYPNVLFISDVRATPPKMASRIASSDAFMKQSYDEMRMQSTWAGIVQARATLLKFKLQYPKEDQLAFERYVDGKIFFQCWAPTPSSETRLIVSKDQLHKEVLYNIPLYAGQIDYFNAAMRTEDFSSVLLSSLDLGITSSGDQQTLGNLWKETGVLPNIDTYIETKTWAMYLQRAGFTPTFELLQKKILEATTAICHSTSDGINHAKVFNYHLNFKSPFEFMDEYEKPVDLTHLNAK
jgi:hypothetical protein